MILGRKFYQRNTLKVARELLGCIIVRKNKGKTIRAVITETEAYRGENDLASHASRGRTPRTELMYGEAGQAYIYLIYGMYYCLNIVTEKKDYPAAVLIRGLANMSEWRANKREWIMIKNAPKLDGPGKVCRELKIDKQLNGWDLTRAPKQSLVRGAAKGEKLWIEYGKKIKPAQIKKTKRVGVDYAKHCKEYLWRFWINPRTHNISHVNVKVGGTLGVGVK